MESINSISNGRMKRKLTEIKQNKFIYALLLPAIVLTIIFNYVPITGIKIAFQDYNIYNPNNSAWVGFDNFKEIFSNPELIKAIINTLTISLLSLVICFPAGVILALLINEVKQPHFKKIVQTITYLPHFLSWIAVISLATSLYSRAGIINDIKVSLFGGERILYLAQQSMFVPNLIILSLWKTVGWSSIVYLAAICGVDTSLYEAARIDGATRGKQIWHITIPSIAPTIIIMLLWQCAKLFNDNFELVFGLQNAFIDFEVMQTVIYKKGIMGGDYEMATAFGLFQGVVNFIVLFVANTISKKISDVGLF